MSGNQGYCLDNLELLQQALTPTEVQVHLPNVLQDLVDVRGDVRELSYTVLNEWLWEHHQDYFSDAELHDLAKTLQQNVRVGLAEGEEDDVFTRCFSSLILGELFALNAQRQFWTEATYQEQVAQFLDYFEAEQDVRGKVDNVTGWVHALAHASDGLMHIASNPMTNIETLQQILELLRRKFYQIDDILTSDEDERFANAAISVLKQTRLEPGYVQIWLEQLSTAPKWQKDNDSWLLVYDHGQAALALFNNTKNFLRSLYLQLAIGNRPEHLKGLLPYISDSLRRMDIGFLSLD
jgi:hypothetical protein